MVTARQLGQMRAANRVVYENSEIQAVMKLVYARAIGNNTLPTLQQLAGKNDGVLDEVQAENRSAASSATPVDQAPGSAKPRDSCTLAPRPAPFSPIRVSQPAGVRSGEPGSEGSVWNSAVA